jgi:hypothetical protein
LDSPSTESLGNSMKHRAPDNTEGLIKNKSISSAWWGREVALLLVVTSSFISAQPRGPDASARLQEQATLTLHQLLDEAKAYEDLSLRVRVKIQIADLLWPTEPVIARETIAQAYREASTSKEKLADRHALRSEAIRVIRKHDPALAARLIADAGNESTGRGDLVSQDEIERIMERGAFLLDGAHQLLEAGDKAGAIALASASLGEGRSPSLLRFLGNLQQHDPSSADQLFLSAVETVRKSSADPNDILFLGQYIFSPGGIGTTTVDGQLIIGGGEDLNAAGEHAQLMGPYLQAAAEILTRATANQDRPGDSGRALLKGYTIQLLLPLFAQYLPGQTLVMKAELEKLNPSVVSEAASIVSPTRPKPTSTFPEGLSLLEEINRIEEISDLLQRDEMFLRRASLAMSRKDFDRSMALAGHVSNRRSRESWLAFIGFNQARALLGMGELDKAEKTVSAHLSPDQRAVVYSWIASAWLKRGEKVQADRLVYSASAEAAKIDQPELRARTYIFLALGIAPSDPSRAFGLAESAILDINTAKDYNLDESQMKIETRSPSGAVGSSTYASSGGFLSLMPFLTRVDLPRALRLGWSLAPAEARAFTLLAACRTVLNADNQTAITAPVPER